jgi:Raf kinase inhibitor-like YbhB/YbcL family protein
MARMSTSRRRSPRPILSAAAGALVALAAGCRASEASDAGGEAMAFQLTSASFKPNQSIPSRHTCEGSDVSPALAWSGAPAVTKSYALVVDDPDAPDPAAPKMTWVHWVLYDIPPSVTSLDEGAPTPSGAHDGMNDWKASGYRGPCPPIGRHRYVHKVYALDAVLPDLGSPNKAALERAMKGHILAQATLVGTYQKSK